MFWSWNPWGRHFSVSLKNYYYKKTLNSVSSESAVPNPTKFSLLKLTPFESSSRYVSSLRLLPLVRTISKVTFCPIFTFQKKMCTPLANAGEPGKQAKFSENTNAFFVNRLLIRIPASIAYFMWPRFRIWDSIKKIEK